MADAPSTGPVAVTGACGQLGSEFCRQLGDRVVPLDLPVLDLLDAEGVRAAIARAKPQVVINAAGYTRVDDAEGDRDRCWAVNAAGVAHLVDACRRTGSVLVQISTDYVFGGGADPGRPYREGDAPAPQGVYAQSKLAGEEEARRLERHYIVRTCGLYGPLSGPGTGGRRAAEAGGAPGGAVPSAVSPPGSAGNFVETMLRLGRQRPELRVVADQRCTPSYVRHVARAVLFLITTGAYGTYHVVNGGETTWYDFAQELFRLVGYSVRLEPVTTEQYGAPAARPRYSVLDTAKYHALPGRPPLPAWRDALAEYLRAR